MDDSARAEAFCVPVEKLKKAAGEIEADVSKREHKLHRFPASMRPLGERYIVPTCVAIGPYHRRLPQVQEMEKGKRAAAYHFMMTASSGTLEEMHAAIRSVVDKARSLYADDATAGIEDPDEFVAMMFHDACFLLEFMDMCVDGGAYQDPSLLVFFMSKQQCIARDIMLLENQLPWLVVEKLMSFKSVQLEEFLVRFGRIFQIEKNLDEEIPLDLDSSNVYEPPHGPHLLALIRSSLIGGDTSQNFPATPGPLSTSLTATKLEEIGISLTASKRSKFMDISIKKRHLFGKLSLPPLLLESFNACWLVNMAAFEECMASSSWEEGEKNIVCSYLCLLGMLMDREEDVYKLRRKNLLRGVFTDKETLRFFKSLVEHVRAGSYYIHIMTEVDAYKQNRWIRIELHKFIYNNFKTIVTVLSVIGVLVGIFKTLLSIKQHR